MTEDLRNRIRQCPNLPSLPAIAVQVLDLAQKADVDIAEIARIISRDPAMSSKILRTVNSTFYARGQQVSTVSHALVILGLQSVKTLVLGFSLVMSLNKKREEGGFNYIDYWKRSIFAATAARNIALKVGIIQQEEAFLAALLADIGMLVLDQALGPQYARIMSRAPSHEDLSRLERAELGTDHAEVAGMLATQWKLPPLLSIPMASHHNPAEVTDAALRRQTELIGLSGRCADVFVLAQPAETIAAVRALALSQHKINDRECDALLEEIGARTREVASLFEINLGPVSEFEEILRKANDTLVDLTLKSQQQATAFEKRATTLAEQNQQLRRQAITDALTGLPNRARFDQFLNEQFAAARRDNKPMSLLMVDVDKFKAVNDEHGHQVGDEVLRSLGRLLLMSVRSHDLAARYGGEEMVLAMPNTTRNSAAAIAESIRRAVAAKTVQCGRVKLSVTISIGVAGLEESGPFTEAAHLLKAADLAVYAAKRAGKNCVRVFSPAASPAKPAA